jgi:hypothetical protein
MLEMQMEADRILRLRVSGRLVKRDYERFVPAFERIATAGPVRMLIELQDFQGWDLPGLWEELKFDALHQDELTRIAVVGESAAQALGTRLSNLFFRAEVRYFPREDADEARRWLGENMAADWPQPALQK